MVDASGTETTLDDLETAAPAGDDVVERDADVVVDDLEVALRSVVVAEHGHGTDELDSLGVGRDDHDRLLGVLRCREVRLAHHEVNGVARVSGSRDPPTCGVHQI